MGYFLFSVFKSPTTQPSVRWVNSYNIYIPDADLPADVDVEFHNWFTDFESAFLLERFEIVQTTLATATPDGTPYNPETFTTYPWAIPGLRDEGGNMPLSLRDVLYVRKAVSSGRTGKLFYRGVLLVTDVLNPTGEYSINPASALDTTFDGAYADLALNLSFNSVSIILPGGVGFTERIVSGLEIAGVRSVSRNHRWYNTGA